MKRFGVLFLMANILSCSTDSLAEQLTLSNSFTNQQVVQENVIACAASSDEDESINVFFYPRNGATNFQYFETADASVDKDNFDNYIPVIVPVRDVFNGYLKKFEIFSETEKWIIVSFDEGLKTHLSAPIRLKHLTKPTEYISENVSIDASTKMPVFSWQNGRYADTEIYFQVISSIYNNLLSGTYTYEKQFQYYNLDLVVLNITTSTPPELTSNLPYKFSLLGVSEDNWVNFFSEKIFTVN